MPLSLTVRDSLISSCREGKALLHPHTMTDNGIAEGDIIEIRKGLHGRVMARAAFASEDIDSDTIQLDSYQRKTAKAALGTRVGVEKVDARSIKKLYLLPSKNNSVPSEELKLYLRQILSSQSLPVCKGTTLCINLPRDIGSAHFKVTGVEPDAGIVVADTEVEIVSDIQIDDEGDEIRKPTR